MYSAETVAQVSGAPLGNVQVSWPQLVSALAQYGINDHPTRVAVIGTVSRETGIWLPIEEEGGWAYYVSVLGEAEALYHGRGFLQITWSANYRTYGEKLGIDLVGNPALALDPAIAAKILCLYFIDRDISGSARACDWWAVQTKVNGGGINWDTFKNIVDAITAIPEPPDPAPTPPPAPVTRVTTETILRTEPEQPEPEDHGNHAIGPDGKAAVLHVGQVVVFGKDPSPGPYHGMETTPHWVFVTLPGSPARGWVLRSYLQTSGG